MLTAIVAQLLNGVQFGVLLFLLAAGLTLIFGIMDFVNLAHGCLYMLGAYFAATAFNYSGSFALAIAASLAGCFVVGIVLEKAAISRLYEKDYLSHVLATFGLILFFNEMVRTIWGAAPYRAPVPGFLSGTVTLLGIRYSTYRFAIILAGLLVAVGCYWLIRRTRLGMLIRAGASNPRMVSVLGVNINLLKTLLFSVGAALAGFAGAIVGPIVSVQPVMGEPVLIMTLVVIVIGGIGSVRGAFYAALIVGLVDTSSRAFLPLLMSHMANASVTGMVAPALTSMMIYLLMAVVLAIRPNGLFPVKAG